MIDNKQLSDDELISMIRSGRQAALLRLYKMSKESIRNLILKNQGSEMDAEDMLQEALIITWQKVIEPEFKLSAKLTTFVYAVAKNLWLARLRKNGRLVLMDDDSKLTVQVEERGERMDMKLVRACMDEIGQTCKQLLGFFYFDGFTMDKIAELMDFANSDTAKAKKYQCMKKLETVVKAKYTKQDLL